MTAAETYQALPPSERATTMAEDFRKLIAFVNDMEARDKRAVCGFYNDEAWLNAYEKAVKLASECKEYLQ